MTVNTTDITSGPYTGNDIASTFSYTFRVTDKTQLKVYETDTAGVRTLLTVDTDYTVANIGEDTGGIITRVAGALPAGYIWYIRSDYKFTQLSALPSQGPFFPDVHEDAFDKLTFLDQQQEDILNRTFRLSDEIDVDGDFTIDDDAANRSGKHLSFDTAGDLQTSVAPQLLTVDGIYDSVALMKVDSLATGLLIQTRGYYTAGDGGAATYLIVAPQAFDGYGDHELANGNVAVLQTGGVINVLQVGAKIDGTDNTAILNACNTLLPSTGGEIIIPTGGTYTFNFASNGAPLVTFTKPVKLYIAKGATIKPTADAAVTTQAQEQSQYIFYADNIDGIHITGQGKFDGNRGGAINPHAGLLQTQRCSNVSCHGITFDDVDNAFSGCVNIDSYNGTTNEFITNIHVSGNTYRRCSVGVQIENSTRGITIHNNKFYDMDLTNPNTGVSRGGSTAFPGRCIKVVGFEDSTSLDGDIGDISIKGNIINNATYGIEVWNQDAINGRNPANAHGVVITGNNVKSLLGIGVNSYSDFNISGNRISYSQFTAAELTAYAGYSSGITDTSASGGNSAGSGIEARPGYAGLVEANQINLGFTGSGTDYTASSFGIVMGDGSKNIVNEVDVVGNSIQKCYTGIKIDDLQNSSIKSNNIKDCERPVDGSVGTNTQVDGTGNEFSSNRIKSMTKTLSNQTSIDLYHDWDVIGNTIYGDSVDAQAVPLLRLRNTTGVYSIKGNNFKYFEGEAILDDALDVNYDGNIYDGGQAADSVYGAVTFTRIANKIARIGTEHVFRCSCAYAWVGAAATGESYTATNVILDLTTANLHKSKSAGTIYNLYANHGYRASVPAAGNWSAGSRFYSSSPSPGGSIGWVCTTSGAPGTWKVFGTIAV